MHRVYIEKRGRTKMYEKPTFRYPETNIFRFLHPTIRD